MQSQSDWILALLQEYKRETLQTPVFVSDWDTINAKAEYPEQLIRNALDIDARQTFVYSFSDEQEAIKSLIINKLGENNREMASENLAISISATAAIYLSLIALAQLGFKRFLIFTPVYYSIVETLTELGLEIHYFDLTDNNDFEIDIQRLSDLMAQICPDALVINDPIYCVGKKIEPVILDQLVNICNTNNCLIFLDNTLGGLDWLTGQPNILETQKICALKRARKYLLIDSLTKRLLVNGLKHAIVFTYPALVNTIEDLASRVYGGFCFPQLQFMTELYEPKNAEDVLGILQHNAQLIRDNFQLLAAFLRGSSFKLYPAESGYFTMIGHQNHLCREVDINDQIKKYLFQHNTFLLPPWYFNFHSDNHFALRVNLLKDPSVYLSSLDQCIREKVKLLH